MICAWCVKVAAFLKRMYVKARSIAFPTPLSRVGWVGAIGVVVMFAAGVR